MLVFAGVTPFIGPILCGLFWLPPRQGTDAQAALRAKFLQLPAEAHGVACVH